METLASPQLAPWTGSHGGLPPLDRVDIADFKPALIAAMASYRQEIAHITAQTSQPTFENTIAAFEDAGRAFARVTAIYHAWSSTRSDADMQAVETEMAPVLAAFSDELVQNEKLFARIGWIHESGQSGLAPEQQRCASELYRYFARQGAALDPPAKEKLARINRELAALYTRFAQNELADEENDFLVLEDETDLAGLPDSFRSAAAADAVARGLAGRWIVSNTRSAVEPFLTHARNRDLREKAFRMWASRGDRAGAHDNNAIASGILALRAEKAKLLGFSSFAHWATDGQMAKTPDAVLTLLMNLWAPAVSSARKDIADMQAMIENDGGGFALAAWDHRYYAEKLRKKTFDIADDEIKPYLALDNVLAAVFWVASRLYGFDFEEVPDAPRLHPDMRAFVVRKAQTQTGFLYFDPFARAGKQSGAWMSDWRAQERFRGDVTPIVGVTANFVPGRPDVPVLLSWDDATTLFHEFGHALHGLSSNVTYPSLSGTNVLRDFVEFPSQLNERWLLTSEVLSRFARHYRTGAPMPDSLVARIKAAKTFNQGFATVEYLASAIVDIRAHCAGAVDSRAFAAQALTEIGMPDEIVMRHRMPHFGHIFSGEGYAAGYYVYLWADVLVADAAEAFEETPAGFFDRALARRLHDEILSTGNTIDPADAYRRFRGRDATVAALLRARGFVHSKDTGNRQA